MSLSVQISKHVHDVHFGGNWTVSSVFETLKDVTWQQAVTKVESFNTIAVLTFHISYFVKAAVCVLEGKELTANDKYSFDHPPINNQKDWENMVNAYKADVERLVELIKKCDDKLFFEDFANAKYGNYFRNLMGIVEHTHYHLGQIALIKKIVPAN